MSVDAELDPKIAKAIARRHYAVAFELVARSYGPAIGRLCMGMVQNQAEAEELTQEVLLAAHQALPSFEARSSVRTWVFGIARRVCAGALRKQGRRQAMTQHLLGGEPAPHAPTVIDGYRHALHQALLDLSEEQREVLLLRYGSGLSYREVAAICGVREDTARQRACAALRAMREQLDQEGRARRASLGSLTEVMQ